MQKAFFAADDYGRTPARNQAIEDCFKNGWIKSAGLMVTGQYMQDALDRINKGGYIKDIHCHLNLTGNVKGENAQDRPVSEEMKKSPSFCSGGLLKHHNFRKVFFRVFEWKTVYAEIVAQYELFLKVTNGEGNRQHVDFHGYYNLTLPAAIALGAFTRKYKIKSVRYYGVHHTFLKFVSWLSWNPSVKYYRASNIEYYINKAQRFKQDRIELYCHPNYVDGLLVDASASYLHRKSSPQTMEAAMALLSEKNIELISWAEE